MTADISISARNVIKDFGGFRALDDISLEIRKNEFFTLLGPSGCGKTTLLRLIAGFEVPTKGHIELSGQDITNVPPFRRPVNTVFQSYALFPHLTCAQNIGFGLARLGREKSEIDEVVRRMLKLVKLEELAARKPHQLSGGQQQRVALARALAPAPELLLLDEPLSALDQKLRKGMQIELKRLQRETGVTFIFVTHDQEEALTMSDRIGVMSNGLLQQVGTPKEIYNHPANRFVADFIGETKFLAAGVGDTAGEYTAVTLDCGYRHRVPASRQLKPGDSVIAAIRPESLVLTDSGAEDSIAATVTDAIYFGTDTHCHVELDNREALVIRLQNARADRVDLNPGSRVGVHFDPDAVQVLEA
jgi:spermidine/putrescine transport system ATP-binding protein